MKLGAIAVTAVAMTLVSHAAAAAPFTSTVIARTIGYKSIEYTINNKATHKSIAVPVVGRPVHIMVTDVTPYFPGAGEAVLVANQGTTLIWSGHDFYSDQHNTREFGSSQNPGAHILWADYVGTVDVQVENETTLQIHNASGGTQNVIVTFTW